VPQVDVHGGATFSGRSLGLVQPGTELHEDGWWFGFHCIHPGDAMIDPHLDPVSLPIEALENWNWFRHLSEIVAKGKSHFWTKAEVEAETEHLAEQLAARTATGPSL
jgi:hypothetical protein